MKSQVKIITLLVFLLVSWGISCNISVRDEKIPVTTESKNARSLYESALEFYEKVYIPQAMDLFEGALAEDPDFFMAAYYLATYNLYFERDEEFARYAGSGQGKEKNRRGSGPHPEHDGKFPDQHLFCGPGFHHSLYQSGGKEKLQISGKIPAEHGRKSRGPVDGNCS